MTEELLKIARSRHEAEGPRELFDLLAEIEAKLTAEDPMMSKENRRSGHFYVLMTTEPGPEGEFVELEDANGRSVRGRWLRQGDLWVLEIPKGEGRKEQKDGEAADQFEVMNKIAGSREFAQEVMKDVDEAIIEGLLEAEIPKGKDREKRTLLDTNVTEVPVDCDPPISVWEVEVFNSESSEGSHRRTCSTIHEARAFLQAVEATCQVLGVDVEIVAL